MKKKYKRTINEQIRDNVSATRTSITKIAHGLKSTGDLGSGALIQTLSLMINSVIEDASKQITEVIFTKSSTLDFVYSKSNLTYIKERLLETYPLEITRMYCCEIELTLDIKNSKSQLEISKNVASQNVKNTIEKSIKEYSSNKQIVKKTKRVSRDIKRDRRFQVALIIFGAILTTVLAKFCI